MKHFNLIALLSILLCMTAYSQDIKEMEKTNKQRQISIDLMKDVKEPKQIFIWNNTPNSDEKHWPSSDYHEEWSTQGKIITGVTEPAIQLFLPDSTINTGVAVIICPGGGYQSIWIDKEGWQVAKEFKKRGIAGIVLKYRYYDKIAAVQDAQRAVSYVRAHANEFHLKPNAIGIGGFSAGGHLSLNMAAHLKSVKNWKLDAIDSYSNRPDFIMAIYPSVYLSEGAIVDASYPPSFFASAANDAKMKPEDIFDFFKRLQKLGVASEIHIYEKGGHGFATGTSECNCSSWIGLFCDWLKGNGMIMTSSN